MKSSLRSYSENNSFPIFPAFFFPNISYFHQISRFPCVYLEKKEHFIKQTFRNRCYILSASGPLLINVPIIKQKEKKTSMEETKIFYDEKWNKRAWRSIYSAYGKSPYFEFYKDDIENFFTKKYSSLFDMNFYIILYFFKKFNIKTSLIPTTNFEIIDAKIDFRNYFSKEKPSIIEDKDNNNEEYIQCFDDKLPFFKNLSCIDLLFNLGNNCYNYINFYKK